MWAGLRRLTNVNVPGVDECHAFFDVDIVVNNATALANTKLLRLYGELSERARKMVVLAASFYGLPALSYLSTVRAREVLRKATGHQRRVTRILVLVRMDAVGSEFLAKA